MIENRAYAARPPFIDREIVALTVRRETALAELQRHSEFRQADVLSTLRKMQRDSFDLVLAVPCSTI